MFRLFRNLHLALGLTFFLMALLFALSSLVIIYRPFLPETHQDDQRVVKIEGSRAATPRALALELMSNHGLSGELRQIEETPESIRFNIVRPGTRATITYDLASRQATIETRGFSFLETLVQLHVNHGFWHEFLPSNLWALLSLLVSAGLLLLGASGLYLWFRQRQERLIGGVLVAAGLIYALTALVLSRA
ncbi:MAG: hypothetical protein ACRD1R_15835 [Acidobacteriota bacterium]